MRFPRSPSPIKTASCVTLIACTLLHLYSLPPVNCMHISSQPVARTPEWLPAARRLFPLWKCFPGGTGCGACMEKKMGEAVARVARKVNETVENGADSLDLADCKLMMFPIGIYKVMRNVAEGIHLITLANNELKSVTSKFITTFSQMRGHCLPEDAWQKQRTNPSKQQTVISVWHTWFYFVGDFCFLKDRTEQGKNRNNGGIILDLVP
ncbi:leucine-rich repeat-containing protein 20 isoform X4 [Chelonia mydas]|uniref:leucine-rich repeat-containing protein 20 isoform X4 n=1 Tax=Chelonia mydas TaxID=8469 RepID=UPI001CA91A7F|nr:leucine-rich repeat-containing protein 20 isoform X4 [Chelonia mydas]